MHRVIASEDRIGVPGWVAPLLALVAALVAIALLPDSASAQSAFCQQYPDDPACLGDVGPGGGNGAFDPGVGFGPGVGAGDGSGDGAGNLPFTGYPITPLLLLLLILLLIGLALRTYLAVRDRLRKRAAVAGMPPLD
jgi:hypothetical protein